jgi:hypothetical protein
MGTAPMANKRQSANRGRDGRALLALSADGRPLTFDFAEVIPLPSFSLHLGFRDAGIDRNVHNAWAYSSRAASCVRKLWNKIPRRPSNLAFQFRADFIFVPGWEQAPSKYPGKPGRVNFHPWPLGAISPRMHIVWAYSSRSAPCIRKLWNKIPRQPSNLEFQFSVDLVFVSDRGTRSVSIPRQTRSHMFPPVATSDDLTKGAYCVGIFIS